MSESEIVYACNKCDHWADTIGLCPNDGMVLTAHDSRCNDDCPRCKGLGACSDFYMGECLPCTGECLPHSERCGEVCDFECPRYKAREDANFFVPEIEPHAQG